MRCVQCDTVQAIILVWRFPVPGFLFWRLSDQQPKRPFPPREFHLQHPPHGLSASVRAGRLQTADGRRRLSSTATASSSTI
jgi:hypothetical protein